MNDIAGLRQQILANAVVLYPKVVRSFQKYSPKNWNSKNDCRGYLPPTDAFEVVLEARDYVTYTAPSGRVDTKFGYKAYLVTSTARFDDANEVGGEKVKFRERVLLEAECVLDEGRVRGKMLAIDKLLEIVCQSVSVMREGEERKEEDELMP